MRRATEADIPRLVEMGAAMHAESRFAKFRINLQKGEQFFRALLLNDNALVLVDGDPVCAMFVGCATPFWWGDDLESWDVLFYVEPAKRGGSHAPRMIMQYVKWAEAKGVADIKLGANTGIKEERTTLFLERLGFKHFGSNVELAGRTIH